MRVVQNLNGLVAVKLTSTGLDIWKKASRSVDPLWSRLYGQRLILRLVDLIRVFGPALSEKSQVFEDNDLTLLPDGATLPIVEG